MYFVDWMIYSVLAVQQEDIVSALQVVVEYLTESMASKLILRFDLSRLDIYSQPGSRIQSKRKADWEVELEVSSLGYTTK